MKKAHYDNTTKRLIGFYDTDINKTVPTPNFTISKENWLTAINNNFNCVDMETKTLFLKDFRTQEQIEKDIVAIKWDDYDLYISKDIPSYEADSGNTFSISKGSLLSVINKINTLLDNESILWVEDDASFQTNKVELLEVFKAAEKLKQSKLNEIFGA